MSATITKSIIHLNERELIGAASGLLHFINNGLDIEVSAKKVLGTSWEINLHLEYWPYEKDYPIYVMPGIEIGQLAGLVEEEVENMHRFIKSI